MADFMIVGIFIGVLVASTVIQEFVAFAWSGMKDVLRVLFGIIGVACLGLGILSAMGYIILG
jgi:hypothetical protein